VKAGVIALRYEPLIDTDGEALAKLTRAQGGDLMAWILQVNEGRLVDAVMQLVSSADEPPTEGQVVQALERVGIKV
jgi:hypothetical protein